MLERFHDYLERSFLPGRTFTVARPTSTPSCAGFARRRPTRAGCGCWAAARTTGSARTGRRCCRCRRWRRRSAGAPAPGCRGTTTSALDSNDYSVHPSVVGRRVEVHADLDRVWVTCEGAVVADHARVWAQHQTITDFEHTVAGASACATAASDLLRPVADAAPARRSRSARSTTTTPHSGLGVDDGTVVADGHPHDDGDDDRPATSPASWRS